MPEKDLWPINDMWNLHYFGQMAFNAGPERHTAVIENSYGGAKDAKEFCTKSQWVSYESNKALYEGWLDHMWNDATRSHALDERRVLSQHGLADL